MRAAHARPGSTRGEVVLRTAEYTFAQLSGWREGVRDALFAIPEVGLVDVDERANRLVVGLRGGAGRAAALQALHDAGVPGGAVAFEGMDLEVDYAAYQDAAPYAGCGSLRGTCRNVIGGLMITYPRDGKSWMCTIGFTALSGGQPRFVTAAHCSDDEWNTDYVAYAQPTPGYSVGSESLDPRGWSCGFGSIYKCRYSDANLVTSSVRVDVGYIARPAALGSTSISASAPRFTVASQRDAYSGERVYAIGRTTGMVTGTVDKTCTDYKKTWGDRYHAVLCSDVGNYNSSSGDSGGPVVLWNGSSETVTLVGINYARNGTYDHAFFSPMSGIQTDLGSLEARAPEYRSTGGGGGGGGGACEPTGVPTDTQIIEPC